MFLKKNINIIVLLLILLIYKYYTNNKYFLYFQKPYYTNGVCYQTSFAKSINGEPLGSQFMSDIGVDINWNNSNGMRNKKILTNNGNINILDFLKQNNVNCIRIYNATLDFSHEQFFKDLEKNELQVMYPINEYFCYGLKNDDNDDSKLKNFLNKMIQETKKGSDYRNAIHSFAFGNEGNQYATAHSYGRYQNYPNISWATRLVEVIDIFVNLEKENNIDSKIDIVIPLSYAGGQTHGQFKMLSNLVDNKPWKDRFVLGINAFNDAQTIINEMDYIVQYNKPFYLTEYSPPPHTKENFEREIKNLWKYHNEKKKLKGVFAFSFLSQVTKEGDEKNFDITRYQDSKYNVEKCENILDGKGNFAELGNPQCPPQTATVIDYNNKFEGISNAFKSYVILNDDSKPEPLPEPIDKYECNNSICKKSSNGQYESLNKCQLNCNNNDNNNSSIITCTNKQKKNINVDFSNKACGNYLEGGTNNQYLCYVETDNQCGGQKTKSDCININNNYYWCGN